MGTTLKALTKPSGIQAAARVPQNLPPHTCTRRECPAVLRLKNL